MGGANITTATTTAFDHTPVGTPRGAACILCESNNSSDTDNLVSVAYGGVPMSRARWEHKTTSEFVQCYAYFLGAGIPTGKQSISIVTKAGGTFQLRPCVFTVTAAGDTELDNALGFGMNVLGPASSLAINTTAATNVFICGGLAYGGNAGLTDTTGTNCTHVNAAAFTNSSGSFFRRTAIWTGGATTIGYADGNNDDKALAALALREMTLSAASLPLPPLARRRHHLINR